MDIDAWIEFVLEKGYERIILSGHSLGTEKVVYYMTYGKYKDKISAIILFAPATMYSSKEELVFLETAQNLVKNGQGDAFLPRNSYSGIMPKSAESFVDFLGPNSEGLKALPFFTRRLENYGKIIVPILVLIGDQEEWTHIPIVEALDLMRRENKNTQAHQIKDCDHDFQEKEEEVSELVLSFIKS